MATIKEIPNPTAYKKPVREVLTPHRLTVAILIRYFFKLRETSKLDRKSIRDFSLLSLHLIQSPDLSLEELRNLISSGIYNICEETLLKKFDEVICSISNDGVRTLLDVVDSIGRLMAAENNLVAKGSVVNKNSVIGYFLRRIVIHFDKLTFSEITTFLESYKKYSASVVKAKDSMECTGLGSTLDRMKGSKTDCGVPLREWSRRQAELFIATQSALIVSDEEKAMSPDELQENIKQLLTSNPDLAEAHFLKYLNYMRMKEFCGAIDSLYHCFDKCTVMDTKVPPEERIKSYRFSALNLAILHYQFGHNEEALAALKESIKMAQEANDNVCLQHSLAWLYYLTSTNRHKLMEHSILKSLDLNLSYIMSLGIQSFVKYAGITMGNPRQIFDTITKSDIINCQNSHRDLISSSYSQKSAVWQFYGKSEMSSLWSQLLLYLNMDLNLAINKTYYGEGYCQALCSLASQLHQAGDYALSNAVMYLAKERFPNEPISHTWMLCEKVFQFEHLLYQQQFSEAELIATKLAVVDKWESYLRLAEVLIQKKHYNEAHSCVNQILDKCRSGSRKFRMDVQVRAMLLLADIQICTSFTNTVIPGILGLINSSLAYANDYNLQYLASIAQLNIAHVHFLMSMPTQGLVMLDRCLIQILAHGGCYDRAKAVLLYVKCLVADANNKSDDERNQIMLDATRMLQNVRKHFEKAEAFDRVKEVLHLQAQFCNELNLVKERNQCAIEYRLLDEEHPSTSVSLVTFL